MRCPKNNQFAVFLKDSQVLVAVSRKPGAALGPPPTGEPALIDPRREDPMACLWRTLGLNRGFLSQARSDAYGNYRARLREYCSLRREGASGEELERYVHAIRRLGHPTVWREMQRQHLELPGLRELFAQAPEALGW